MLRRKFREKSNMASIKHNTDFVLDNFLEAEVKTILLPLYVAQCLSLAPKYSIRDNFITSNGHKFNAFVFLCAILIGMTWIFSIPNFLTKTAGLLTASAYIYCIIIVLALTLNAFITTRQSNINAYFIILLQRILKRFMFVKIDNRGITIVNWLYLILVIGCNIAHFGARILEVDGDITTKIFTHLIYLSIDCNNIIAIRMIHFLGKLIETWISELEHFCRVNCFDSEAKDSMNKIIIGYEELIEAVNVCNKVFRVPIFFTVLTSFFQVFVNVQSAIYMPVWIKSMYVGQIIWIKNFTLLAILCMESENIHLNVKNAQVTRIVLTASETTTDLSQLGHRQSQSAHCAGRAEWLRAAGLFPVDAALPPRFFSVLATYVIVILQFQFQ
nr:gustatory receptor 43.1 [Papilio memnon]